MILNTRLAAGFILAIAMVDVQASKETSEACFSAAEAMNDINSVNEAHDRLIKRYNDTCREANLCYGAMNDQLENSMNAAGGNPADLFETANTVPMTVTGTASFDGVFMQEPSYADYKKECEKVGGTLACIDGDIKLIGEVGGVLAEADGESGGNDLDIELYLNHFPLCMPPECDGEDLKEVLVDATRDAVLNSPDVQGALNEGTENILKEITFESLCALGGPPVCELKVERVSCSSPSRDTSSASWNTVGANFSILMVVFVLFAL